MRSRRGAAEREAGNNAAVDGAPSSDLLDFHELLQPPRTRAASQISSLSPLAPPFGCHCTGLQEHQDAGLGAVHLRGCPWRSPVATGLMMTWPCSTLIRTSRDVVLGIPSGGGARSLE